jgi:hypothetical protein
MAKRLHQIGRRSVLAAGTILLGTVGCAFPHGSTGGDPLLGNFHRPIVPTPPPERGGLGLDSPAYDAGARIGVTSPDIPTPVENSSGFQSLPSLTSPNLFSGARTPFGTADDSTLTRRPMGASGARLPSPSDTCMRLPSMPAYTRSSNPDAVTARPRDPLGSVTSAAAFTPTETTSPIHLASHEVPRDPAKLERVEDAQAYFQSLGARGQRTEQLSAGEWFFTCAVGSKVYEARGRDQFDAMKKAAEQIQRDR